MIFDYFKQLKDTIEKYSHIVANSTTNEKTYSNKRGFIAGKIHFTDETRLEFAEVKDIEKQEKIKYSYHYMDSRSTMQFRYDNTKHFPDIPSFPHHKHIQTGVIKSKEPEMDNVLAEIEKQVIKKR